MDTSDLMYMEESYLHEQIQTELLADFPTVTFRDGSDFIHRYRFTVEIENLEMSNWYLWLLRKGWFQFSFNFQFDSMDKPEKIKPLMQQVIAERNKQIDNGIPF